MKWEFSEWEWGAIDQGETTYLGVGHYFISIKSSPSDSLENYTLETIETLKTIPSSTSSSWIEGSCELQAGAKARWRPGRYRNQMKKKKVECMVHSSIGTASPEQWPGDGMKNQTHRHQWGTTKTKILIIFTFPVIEVIPQFSEARNR